MNLKKLLSLLLIFCMVFSFVACGTKDVDDDDDGRKPSSSQRDDDEDDEDEDDDKGKGKDKDKGSDKDDKDSDDDKDTDKDKDADKDDDDTGSGFDKDIFASFPKAELPEGYPKDDYPIYKGGHVWMGMKEDQGGYYVYTVAVVYAEELDTIVDYYEDFLKDAEGYDDMTSAFGNNYKGELAGYMFDITVMGNENEGDPVQATIVLSEIPSSGSVLKSLDEAELPDEYPIGDFPIIDGAALYNASESESNGVISYELDIYTDKTIKEIIKFYDDNLTNVENKSKSSDSDNFSISGTSNGYDFYIHGFKDNEDNVELVRYYISIDPIE